MKERNRLLLAVIVLFELIAMVAVYPGGIIRRETRYSSGDTHEYAHTFPLEAGDECTQSFIAMGDLLIEHDFSVKVATPLSEDWTLSYELLDPNGEVLVKKSFTGAEIYETGFRTIDLDLKIKKGKEYSYTLRVECGEGSVGVTCTPYPEDFAPGMVSLCSSGEYLNMQTFNQFVYKQKLNLKNVAFTWIFLWIIGCAIWELLRKK